MLPPVTGTESRFTPLSFSMKFHGTDDVFDSPVAEYNTPAICVWLVGYAPYSRWLTWLLNSERIPNASWPNKYPCAFVLAERIQSMGFRVDCVRLRESHHLSSASIPCGWRSSAECQMTETLSCRDSFTANGDAITVHNAGSFR